MREALKKMKTQKSDAIFDTVSDFYINGPDNLVAHLTALVKLYLQHGSVLYFILLCTLVPLVKDNMGDITLSDNYRAIAGGSLLLKLLDTIFLRLLLQIYKNQQCNVKWAGTFFSRFPVSNGVKQGAVSSAIFLSSSEELD